MNHTPQNIALIALAGVLAACGRGATDRSFGHFTFIDSSHVAIHARDDADAIVGADGSLIIDSKSISLTASQKALLKDYYTGIEALRRDAIATGVAGIATAGAAIGSVVAGLAGGNPDSIGPKVDAKAARVEAAAAKICGDLAAIHIQQGMIATELPAFRPYALIDAGEVADCAAK